MMSTDEEQLKTARELAYYIIDFEFHDPRHLNMTREILADKYTALLEAKLVEARIDTINKVFEMSPGKSFTLWKPIDALNFYERLKAYEAELQGLGEAKDHE